jgi:anaerobic selenocysteine-containing dehydrogenase
MDHAKNCANLANRRTGHVRSDNQRYGHGATVRINRDVVGRVERMATSEATRPSSRPEALTETRHSFCRNCSAACGTVLELADGRIVNHRPDRRNQLSEGFFCVKGKMAVEMQVAGTGRLTQCLARDGDGALQPVDKADAVARIGERLAAIIKQHGPESVGAYFGTATYGRALSLPLAKAFMTALGSPKLFSTMTIDQSARWIAYRRMGMFATGKPNIADTDLLVMSGTNPLVSHMPNFGAIPASNQRNHILAMQARGGKMVIIDPRLTETARMADVHLQPRPGFDADIFAALIRLVFLRGGVRADFCDLHVENAAALREAVEPFTPELVGARAGLAAAQLEAVADMLIAARKPLVDYGTGTTMSPHGNTAAHLGEALNALCAGYVRAGETLRSPGIFMPRPPVEMVIAPDREWERGPLLRSGHGQIFGEFPTSRLPDEILTPGPGQLRALIVLGANPAATWGEPARTAAALADLDLLVVLDPRMTETAQLADYVIAPPTQYEVADMSMLFDFLAHRPVVQFTRPVVAPPAGSLDEWRFFHGVASAMGLPLTLAPLSGGEERLVLEPGRDVEAEDLLRWFAEQAGLPWDALSGSTHGYALEAELPVVAPAAQGGARLDLCPSDVAAEIAAVAADPREDAAPYRLLCRRSNEMLNTAFRDGSATLRRFPANPLFMHPADMAREHVSDNDRIEVVGRHGRIAAVVKADASMRPGTLSYHHGWGGDPQSGFRSHVGQLVSIKPEDVQMIDGMPLQSSIPVSVVAVVPASSERGAVEDLAGAPVA